MKKSTQNILIIVVGDILLSDGYFDIGYGMGSQIEKYGAFYPFEKIHSYLRTHDILIGNLECPISESTPKKGLRAKEFLASPLVLEGLKQLDFDVLLVANNHILQHGSTVYRKTIKYLEEVGIMPVGHISREREQQNCEILECKNKTFGFLGYSMVKDEHNPIVKDYAYCEDGNKIIEEIHKNRKKCDYLVLLLHWGDEFVPCPHRKQIELARRFIDEGVDVIIGSHSHVFQGIEMYKGKTIAYSLGNFIFNMPAPICRKTAILSIFIESNGSQKASIYPVQINKYGQPEITIINDLNNVEKNVEIEPHNFARKYVDENQYAKMLRIGLSVHRKYLKKQFIKNIHRVKKKWLLQILYEFLKRRINFS